MALSQAVGGYTNTGAALQKRLPTSEEARSRAGLQLRLSGMDNLGTPSVLHQASVLLILVEVQITVRVHPDRMPSVPRARARWAQPARQHLPIEVQEGDQAVQFGHIHHPGMIDIDVTGAVQALPLGQEVALRGKDLDPIV